MEYISLSLEKKQLIINMKEIKDFEIESVDPGIGGIYLKGVKLETLVERIKEN